MVERAIGKDFGVAKGLNIVVAKEPVAFNYSEFLAGIIDLWGQILDYIHSNKLFGKAIVNVSAGFTYLPPPEVAQRLRTILHQIGTSDVGMIFATGNSGRVLD